MEFKLRRDWVEGRSIVDEREDGESGQVEWRGRDPAGQGDAFLIRIGKDASRLVRGTEDDAREALVELRTELKGGIYQPVRVLRLDTFLRQTYLPWKRKSVAGKTYMEYERLVSDRLIPSLGHHRLDSLHEDTIQEWVDGMIADGLSPKSLRNYFSIFRAALGRAVVLGMIRTNPAAGVVLNTSPDEAREVDPHTYGLDGDDETGGRSTVQAWTAAETQDFADQADPDDEMARWGLVAVRGGFRPGEQCALRWPDCDLETGIVTVCATIAERDHDTRREIDPRTGKAKGRWFYKSGGKRDKAEKRQKQKVSGREIVLPPDAVAMLLRQRASVQDLLEKGKVTVDEALFVFPSRGRGKNPFNNPSNIKDRWRKFLIGRKDRKNQNGLPGIRYITPYELRHTHATDLLRHEWPLFQVAKRLGTSTLMIERHYGHLLPDVQERRISEMTPLPGLTNPQDAMEAVGSENAAGVERSQSDEEVA